MFLSGRIYDDGIIDPRDTRTVLGLCLSVIHGAPVRGRRPATASSGCDRMPMTCAVPAGHETWQSHIHAGVPAC